MKINDFKNLALWTFGPGLSYMFQDVWSFLVKSYLFTYSLVF